MQPVPDPEAPLPLMRVNADWIIETEDDGHDVCETIQDDAPMILQNAGFPHGDIVKIEVLTLAAVTDEEANERGWTE